MRTICNAILLIAVLCPTTTALCAEPSSSAAELTPEQRSEAARPLAAFRRYRTVPARRVEAIKTLAAIAPGAVELARESLEKDFERLGGLIENRPSDPAVEQQIVELRQTLAALRADPNLSKETLKTTGLAALDQLTLLYQQRQARMRTYARKLAAVTTELEQLTAFFNELEAAYADATSVPLPTAKYRQTIAAMAGALAATDEEKLRRAEAENVRRTQGLDSGTVAGMRALNEMRVMCGLEPLLVDEKLCAAATGHSRDMQTNGFFAHESPVPGKRTFQDRAQAAGTTSSGENIYMGSSSAVSSLKAWFLSPPHHRNMLGENHRRQGLGRYGKYWTHLFGS